MLLCILTSTSVSGPMTSAQAKSTRRLNVLKECSTESIMWVSWDYITELKKFVDSGLYGNSFVDVVAVIVDRGCNVHYWGLIDGKADRFSTFYKV